MLSHSSPPVLVLVLATVAIAQQPNSVPMDGAALEATVRFLADDSMKGRDTPSPELDKAADWLSKQFAAAGLQPAFGNSWLQGKTVGDPAAAKGRLVTRAGALDLKPAHLIGSGPGGTSLEDVKVVHWTGSWRRGNADRASAVLGKAVVLPAPAGTADPRRAGRRITSRAATLADDGAVAVIIRGGGLTALRGSTAVPILSVPESAVPSAEDGTEGVTLQLTVPKAGRPYASNVGALLPGSDPVLAQDLIVFSAHYDHVGVGRPVNGDAIYNGADDDATGTAAVLEIARWFKRQKRAPKRSCLFLCFYGEEKGFLGSKHYVANPIRPLLAHKAVFNIEMVGRPDDIARREAWITGYGVSSFGRLLTASGKRADIRFYEHPQRSRMLFGASDNVPFAVKGIPAHSLSAGSLHEDYHRPGDHADKIDFENMTHVVKGIAVAGWVMADGGELPKWDPKSRTASKYREARAKLEK